MMNIQRLVRLDTIVKEVQLMKKHEKNQGSNIVAENNVKSKSTVERLTAEQLRKLTPTERIEYAKRLNGSQPKTSKSGLILDKSTADKINDEKSEKTAEKTKSGKKTVKTKTVERIAKTQTEKVNSFALAVSDFELMYIENGYTIPTNDETLYTLSKAIAFSVIKKLIEVSADKTMMTLRGETVKNFALLDNLNKRAKTDTLATFDSNGNIKCEITDKEYTKAVEKVLNDSLSQGVDIIHQASISILEEVKTIQQKNGKKPLKVGFMLEPYESRKTNGKTFAINGKKSVEWETVEVLPIRNIFKSVRAYIQNNKSVKAVINGYSYIESLSIDNESDEVEKIYYRLQKYADLGEIVTDFNGKEVAYTTTAEEVEQYKKSLADLIIKAHLDQKHIDYINCRLSGKSLVEIAKYIGISVTTAQRIQHELQKKSIAVGYGDESMIPKAENTSKAKPIRATDENGKKYTFESVKSASIQLNIDKSNITACLKGRLKKTKGYTFEYITE